MLYLALWVLEQEYKASKWLWKAGGFRSTRSPSSFDKTEQAVFVVGTTAAIFQTALITSLGYTSVIGAASRLESFNVAVALNEPIAFRMAGGKVTAKFAKHSAGKLLAARVGSRFIPYVGVALLMWDAWHVGKWIGEKTNPFNS